VPEELWVEVCNILQEVVIKTIPREKKWKKWQKYAEELYKKGLDDPDNPDCVFTHLDSGVWGRVALRKHY